MQRTHSLFGSARITTIPMVIMTLFAAVHSGPIAQAQSTSYSSPAYPSSDAYAMNYPANSANTAWDSSSLYVHTADNAFVDVAIAPDGNPIVAAVTDNPNDVGFFEFTMTSNDGLGSVNVVGMVLPDGEVAFETRQTDIFSAAAARPDVVAAAAAGATSEPGFWAGYWYYLTNPSAMDTDLEIGFYTSVSVAAVAGTTAGGLYVAGYTATAAITTGTMISTEFGVVGTQAVVATGLGAGTYPALVVNGTVYVARFHNVAWQLAGYGTETFYGLATIDALGRVISLIR